MSQIIGFFERGINAARQDLTRAGNAIVSGAESIHFVPANIIGPKMPGQRSLLGGAAVVAPVEGAAGEVAGELATALASDAAETVARDAGITAVEDTAASVGERVGSWGSRIIDFLKPTINAAKYGAAALAGAGLFGLAAYYGQTFAGAGAVNLGQGLDYLIGKTPPQYPPFVSLTGQPQPSGEPGPGGYPGYPGGIGGYPIGAPGSVGGYYTAGPTGGPSPAGILSQLSGFDITVILVVAGIIIYQVVKKK